MTQPTIKETQPNTDCKFCELHHYVKADGKTPTKHQYALCNNPKKTMGCMHIDIVFKANPLEFTTSCQNCQEYISKNQLEICFTE